MEIFAYIVLTIVALVLIGMTIDINFKYPLKED
ncbi:hypothetical protein SAMN05216234_14410 [Hydrogenimonas thermophila]|uniref:Uncharacterized protein n=1 Tax=Hydrogenimonas thermophila TaxID=223786 RepID=A0A1I5TGY1_9BACT|nr:hypothetical protein SAMN05216234_14410 [Hydrogenimonas thermophila]